MAVVLIPPVRQTFWGKLAVANLALGGAGAGAYATAALLGWPGRTPLLAAASVLGPLLVAAGFLAVAAETGRPLRGPNVLRRLRSSWMSRELLAGVVFLLAAPIDLVQPSAAVRGTAIVAALVLVLAQGFILARAKGVAAWDTPILPPLFAASGLASGVGLLGLALPAAAGPGGAAPLAGVTAALVVASAILWAAYLAGPAAEAFRRARRPLPGRGALAVLLVAGHALPLVALAAGLALPGAALAATAAAGAGILAGQLAGKSWLVLRAGLLGPITVSSLAFRGTA